MSKKEQFDYDKFKEEARKKLLEGGSLYVTLPRQHLG